MPAPGERVSHAGNRPWRMAECRLHGGLSTGPKTSAGLARSRRANWKHGEYSQERQEELQAFRQGFKTILNPQALFNLSPAEVCMHKAALVRLMGKMQGGFKSSRQK